MERNKNIWVIPTDKPSRLHLESNGLKLSRLQYTLVTQHIYITNSEDINENDYIITKDGRLVQVSYLLSKDLQGASKVILTTDQDLIKDGVQAIEYEFLEWFVKNPSCEFINVRFGFFSITGREVNPHNVNQNHSSCTWKYKVFIPEDEIIIPKEEPNIIDQWLEKNGNPEIAKQVEQEAKELSKQETLEEAAKNYSNELLESKTIQPHEKTWIKSMFIYIAKWQAERMYSEEDFKLFARQYFREIKMDKSNLLWEDLADKCLEQFKKK
jgi:hypothetical protein